MQIGQCNSQVSIDAHVIESNPREMLGRNSMRLFRVAVEGKSTATAAVIAWPSLEQKQPASLKAAESTLAKQGRKSPIV